MENEGMTVDFTEGKTQGFFFDFGIFHSYFMVVDWNQEGFDLILQMQWKMKRVPASSLVKHIGGFILKTFPCSPPFPIRIPISTVKN